MLQCVIHYTLCEVLCGYSVAALSLGDLAGIVPQNQSLHELQQDPDWENSRVGQPKALLGQSEPLESPTSSGGLKLAFLYACPRGRFIFTSGERWGPSLPSAGANSLDVVARER